MNQSPYERRNKEIGKLYMRGISITVIGKQFGLTRERIRQIVTKAGLHRPNSRFLNIEARLERKLIKKLRDEGRSWTYIANRFQTQVIILFNHINPKDYPLPWPKNYYKCKHCGRIVHKNSWYYSANGKRSSWCINCIKEAHITWQRKNADFMNARARAGRKGYNLKKHEYLLYIRNKKPLPW